MRLKLEDDLLLVMVTDQEELVLVQRSGEGERRTDP